MLPRVFNLVLFPARLTGIAVLLASLIEAWPSTRTRLRRMNEIFRAMFIVSTEKMAIFAPAKPKLCS